MTLSSKWKVKIFTTSLIKSWSYQFLSLIDLKGIKKFIICIRKNLLALKARKAAKWPRTFCMVLTVYVVETNLNLICSDEHFVVVDYCPRNFVQLQEVESSDTTIPGAKMSDHLAWLTLLQSQENKTVEWLLSFHSESERRAWCLAFSPPEKSNDTEQIYAHWDCPEVEAIANYVPSSNGEVDLRQGERMKVTRKLTDSGKFSPTHPNPDSIRVRCAGLTKIEEEDLTVKTDLMTETSKLWKRYIFNWGEFAPKKTTQRRICTDKTLLHPIFGFGFKKSLKLKIFSRFSFKKIISRLVFRGETVWWTERMGAGVFYQRDHRVRSQPSEKLQEKARVFKVFVVDVGRPKWILTHLC